MKANAATKSVKFRSAAEREVSALMKGVHKLGKLANRSRYEYTPEEVQQIFAAVGKVLVATQDKFVQQPPEKEVPPSFTFG